MNPENPPSGDPRRYYQDFVDRYQQGPQGISDQEAAARYQQVAPQLPPDDYLRAVQEAFARMSPEDRVQFGRFMAEQAQRQGHDFIDLNQDGIDDRLQDPDYLARTTTQAHQEQPGFLTQLFGGEGGHTGGAGGGMLSNPLAKGVLGGIAAYGLSRMLGGGHHRGGLFGGHHRHRGHHGHGSFEVDDLFEYGGGEDFFGGGGFFGDDDD
ncbi:MAG: hypothetical protein M3272_01730 [Actinomycetota bacterium]|nr:hypothetical protein [Actinomycetota bacterium]